MKTNPLTILATLIICLQLMQQASAVSIGAGPSTIDFGKMVKGGYAERLVTVSTSGDEDLICTVEFTGDLKDWLTLDKGTEFQLPSNSRIDLKALLQPPANTPNGRYDGSIYIKAAPPTANQQGTGLTIGAGIKIKVTAEISDEQIISYKLKRTTVTNTETGYPVKFNVILQNIGNVKVKPDITIEIFDRAGNLRKTVTQSKSDILPTVESTFTLDVPSDELPVGQYTAKLTTGQDEQTVEFNILDTGTLALKGNLKNVELNKIWVETGETSKITAYVENTGDVIIKDAKLNVEIYTIDEKYQTEKLIKTITPDESLDIPVGQTTELTTYYAPTAPGRYTIQATVTYQGKKTPPKSTILNVLERPTNYIPYIIGSTLLIIGVIYWLAKKGDDGRTRRFKKIWGNYLEIK